MTSGPTIGAATSPNRQWTASPVAAVAIRVVIAVAPFVVAWFVVSGFSERFWRPTGQVGLGVWLLQALVTGISVSMATELFVRRLMPLASLFNMTLVFPDQAPSRFSVALRSSTVKQLQNRHGDMQSAGLDGGANSAATTAVELIGLLSRHDRLTRGHTERVRAHAVLIAEEMGVSTADRELLTWGAMLHDIGKLTVSPEILNKPGQPTDAEWAELKGHPGASAKMLAPLEDWLGHWLLAGPQHHERWDGTGYPLGLSGSEISLAGRITAVADAYDVITSRRSYKKPMPVEAARKELIRCAGTQFDPDVVRAFLNVSLRRRWASGPLASLTELPKMLNLGANLQSSAVIVAGATATVGTVTLAPPPIPVELASTAPPIVQSIDPIPADEPDGGSVSPATPVDSVVGVPPVEPADAIALSEETTTSTTVSPATSVEVASDGDSDSDSDLGSETMATTPPTTLWADLSTTAATAVVDPTNPAPSQTTSPPTTSGPAQSTSPTSTSSPATSTTAPPTTATIATTTTAPTTTTTTTTTPTTTTGPTTPTTAPGSPLAINDAETVEQDTNVRIYPLHNDDAGNSAFDEATLEILSAPSHADSYRVHGDHIHYQSNEDYEGTETMVYRICNTNGLCDTGLITLTVEDD